MIAVNIQLVIEQDWSYSQTQVQACSGLQPLPACSPRLQTWNKQFAYQEVPKIAIITVVNNVFVSVKSWNHTELHEITKTWHKAWFQTFGRQLNVTDTSWSTKKTSNTIQTQVPGTLHRVHNPFRFIYRARSSILCLRGSCIEEICTICTFQNKGVDAVKLMPFMGFRCKRNYKPSATFLPPIHKISGCTNGNTAQ